jgi:hypothetical protein
LFVSFFSSLFVCCLFVLLSLLLISEALEGGCRKLERSFLVQWHVLIADQSDEAMRMAAILVLARLRNHTPNAVRLSI